MQIATRVRRQFESQSIPLSELADLYRDYHEIDDVESFVRHAVEIFPRLNCGLASVYLRSVLRQGTVVRGSYGVFAHTFVICGKFVVDITADQFGGPRVSVRSKRKFPWSEKRILRGMEGFAYEPYSANDLTAVAVDS